MIDNSLPLSKYKSIIPEFDSFLQRIKKPLGNFLRINSLKTTREEVLGSLIKHGISWGNSQLGSDFIRIKGSIKPGLLWIYKLGFIHSQTLTSAIPVLALDPKPDEFILDLCAAPGGKTSYLAQLMRNRGLIVANDKNVSRIVALRANLKRLGVLNAVVTRFRGEHFSPKALFPKILVDVPCSGEGRYSISKQDKIGNSCQVGRNLQGLQKALLDRALALLAPAGTLIYSTCTYNPGENESVIQHALDRGGVSLGSINIEFPHELGIIKWQDEQYVREMQKCWRTYPHYTDSVGFFTAKLVKRE